MIMLFSEIMKHEKILCNCSIITSFDRRSDGAGKKCGIVLVEMRCCRECECRDSLCSYLI